MASPTPAELGSGFGTARVTDWAAFPKLEITPDINDEYQTLFWGRLGLMLTA